MIEKTVIKEFIHRIFKYKYHHIGAAICSVIYSILYFNTASIINENSRLWYSQR